MSARAIWKGIISFADVKIPVKLYASVEDRNIHFRLLHRKDNAPVRQAMVNPDTSEVVPFAETRRAFITEARDLVIIDDEDFETIEPEASREIRIRGFLPERAIDHRWYLRPYYLGPDRGGSAAYAALIAAMKRSGREGLAQWVMRKKDYVGALRLVEGYPMLIALRFADQVVDADELRAPSGPSLAKKELDMAGKLMDMLVADFHPTDYRDEYRARVRKLIDTKAKGGKVRKKTAPDPKPTEDILRALEASLKRERKRA